jgi:hypothetical protein
MQNPPVFAHQADFSTWPQRTLIRIKYASDTSELMHFGIAPMSPPKGTGRRVAHRRPAGEEQ